MLLINKELNSHYNYLVWDFRPEPIDGERFDLIIRGKVGSEVLLTFNGMERFKGYKFILEDLRLQKIYNINTNSAFKLNLLHKSNDFSLFIGDSVFIKQNLKITAPAEFSLYQNYPNPFNPSTIIRFGIPENSNVSLSIYNVLGELVESPIVNQFMEQGFHEIRFNGNNYSSGVYLYKISAGKYSQIKKMVLIK